MRLGQERDTDVRGGETIAEYWDDQAGLLSAQFQVGATLSEAVTTEEKSSKIGAGPNTGMAFFEEWLRSIGAVNGNAANVEWWGASVDERCKDFEGRKLLETFLCKRFCLVYDGEKLIGDERIETGTSTMHKDIVLDIRFDKALTTAVGNAHARTPSGKRIMFLIQYHSQLHVRENEVVASF